MTAITGQPAPVYTSTKSDKEIKREKDAKFAKSTAGTVLLGGPLSGKRAGLILAGAETDEQRKSTLKTGAISGGIGAVIGGIGAAIDNAFRQNAGIKMHNLAGGNKDAINLAADTFVSTAKSSKLSAKQVTGFTDVIKTGKFNKKFLAKESLKSAGKIGLFAAGAGIIAASVKHYVDNKKVEKQISLAEAALDNSSDIKAAAKTCHQG